MTSNLLEIKDLQTQFHTEDGIVSAVNGVSFSMRPGETLGVVGESGCGKSVTAMSILRLVSQPGLITGGKICFDGQDLLALSEPEMRKIRGNDIAMIFQEPMTSLNPVFTIGAQIDEVLSLHQNLDKKAARARTVEMLGLVGIPNPSQVADSYPHNLSGGMRQRGMIAMALACNPKLLIADEPTTALDVTIQAQILELMKDLKEEVAAAILLITHDLGVIAEMAQHVVVMYAGRVVEEADVCTLFESPRHPYTIGLLNSKPRIEETKAALESIPGLVPNPLAMPQGCHFHPRCSYATDKCRRYMPDLEDLAGGHRVRCWHTAKTGGAQR